jgi:DamX protein
MSEVVATPPEPAYLGRMALTSLPFSKVSDSAAFYDGRHIKQRRLLLLHIIRATQTPVSIQAEKGMGKTTVLHHLQRETARDLRFCTIKPQVKREQLISQVLAEFGADSDGLIKQDEQEQALKQRLLQLRNLNIVPVLLVDDAEEMAPDVLSLIKAWLSWTDADKTLLQAVLTTQTGELDKQLTTQKVDLPPLDSEDVPAYLKQRLQAVGFLGEFPFSEKDIQRMIKQSKGVPGMLNQLAHQQLLGVKKITGLRNPLSFSLMKLMRWSGLLILVLILIVLVSYQEAINQWVSADREDMSEVEIPELVSDKEIATVVVGENTSEQTNAELSVRNELADLLAEIPNSSDNALPVSEATSPDSEIITKQERIAIEDISEKTGHAVETEPMAEVAVYDSDWIIAQKPTDYTFQLMGSWSYQEVTEFIEDNALTGDIARFTSLRDNKPWHVLVYGVYSSKQAALSASNQWPAPLNTLPTWLRRLDSVQKQITDKGVSP